MIDRVFIGWRLRGVTEHGEPMVSELFPRSYSGNIDWLTRASIKEWRRHWKIAGAECVRLMRVYRKGS